MKTYVLYHRNCADGFCAAWIAKNAIEGPIEFVPVQYSEPVPDLEPDSTVYILDFSYSHEQLREIVLEKECKVILIDHHKTVEKVLEQEVYTDNSLMFARPYSPVFIFDKTKSGARLTWNYFHTDRAPWLVDYTEDRDLWKWELPNSREINAALRSYSFDFEIWNNLSKRDPDELVTEGWAIFRAQQQLVDHHVRNAYEIEFEGYKILTTNATCLQSEIGEALCKNHPFSLTYFDLGGKQRIYSLRSAGEVDVGEIARKHGGGGHKNAAGFEEIINAGS